MTKDEVIKKFKIDEDRQKNIEQYLNLLNLHNKHTNLVGKSTLLNPWNTHILDSLQILPLIDNKTKAILDMGTGAGLPGVILSIFGCTNTTLVDSNGKKINFLENVNLKMGLKLKLIKARIESLRNLKFDLITSRALANLDLLFTYSQNFIKKNTVLVFLKGKTVNDEIHFAKKKWNFNIIKHQSLSDSRGTIIVIKNLNKND